MVYCSAVDIKRNSSRRKRRKEELYISFYGLPRNRDLKRKWSRALRNWSKVFVIKNDNDKYIQ